MKIRKETGGVQISKVRSDHDRSLIMTGIGEPFPLLGLRVEDLQIP